MSCDVVGFSFSMSKNSGVYIPIRYPESKIPNPDDYQSKVIEIIKPIMEDSSIPKTGQNVKFDAPNTYETRSKSKGFKI